MVPMTVTQNTTLASILHERALDTPWRRLVFDLAGGTLVASYALWWRPKGWLFFASAGVCFAMYALWAMAECNLEDYSMEMTRVQRVAWRATSVVTAIAGVLAVFTLMFAAIGPLLGTWIS